MKEKVKWLLAVVLVCLAGCGAADGENYQNADASTKHTLLQYVSQKTEVDVTQGDISFGFDSHGGFHGDGTLYLEIKMPDSFEERLNHASLWSELPLTEKIAAACHMEIDKHHGKDNETIIPEVENGFWYYLDRSPDISVELPLNYTIAVYDSNTDVLYYCDVDM